MPKPGTTTQRSYGHSHRVERAKVKPIVDAGQAWCTEPICLLKSRWIPPGTAWDLAHDRAAGPGQYLGPAHRKCNRSEGATYGNRRRSKTTRTTPRRRRWIL